MNVIMNGQYVLKKTKFKKSGIATKPCVLMKPKVILTIFIWRSSENKCILDISGWAQMYGTNLVEVFIT
jgi:hypothetical protein